MRNWQGPSKLVAAGCVDLVVVVGVGGPADGARRLETDCSISLNFHALEVWAVVDFEGFVHVETRLGGN